MKKLLIFLVLTGTVFGQSNIRYDNYTHAVQKPPTSSGSVYDYNFSGLNISGIASAPGGSDGQFQYNNAGALDGTPSLAITGGGNVVANSSKFIIYDVGSSSNNFKFTTTNLTGSRTVKIPDGNSTTVLPDSGAPHNFLSSIDNNGNISKSQPTGSDIGSGGTIASTTFADTNTYRAKDGSNWRMENASDATKLMQWDLSNLTTGTSRTATMPNGDATLVIADTGAANNFLTGISGTGAVTKARPTISNLTPLSGTSLLIGSNTGVATVNEITLGSGISMTGSTLSATGSGGNVSNSGTPTSGQVALWTDATHIRGSSTIDSPNFTTSVGITSAPLTISGNISSAAWTTSGLRIKGVPSTLTDTTSSGTVSVAFTNVLGGNTIAATNATTFTDYISLYAKEPSSGSNVTLTNIWALGADSLRIGTSNPLKVSNSGVLTLTSPAVLGTPQSITLTNGTGLPTTGLTGTLAAAQFPALTGEVTNSSGSLATTVGTMTHDFNVGTHKVTNVVDPASAQDAATKNYVDASVASFNEKPSVAYASTTALPANTYSNGSSGVGATLTGNSNGPLIIDGVTLVVGAVGQRILVAGESTPANNGWYTLTQLGVIAVSPYILTRATESDQAAEIGAGYLTGVVAPNTLTPGSSNNGKVFISVAADPFTVGTTSLTFSQVGSTYSAGTGLSLSGTTFSIDTATTVDKTTAQVLTNKDVSSGTNTFPTFNQNTTGSAATLTTARNLWGQSFNGSAAVGGAIELGTAGTTDTTLDRVSGGVASIEGANILTSGGALGTPASGVGTNLTGTADGFTAGDVTRNHAVYAGASPPTVDIGLFTIAKTGVNLKAAGNTTGFVVPTGRAFLCTASWALVTAVTGPAAGTETWTIKESAASATMLGGTASGSGTPAVGTYYSETSREAGGPYTQCAAGNTVTIVVTTSQAGSTAVTGTVFIQGFYTQ
jgi:hypothetical protein